MARGHLESIRKGSGVPQECPKRPEGISGAFKMAQRRLGSVRNGPGAPRESSKRPRGA